MIQERLVFYIDGFNLYFGLKEAGWRKYYWLNLQEMCSRLAKPHQKVILVRYFTSYINQSDPAKRLRQKTYLEALETLPLVKIHYGTYLGTPQTCFKCGHTFTKHNEKKSDVNIAVKLLTDALDNLYEIAVLVSADSDLVPAVEAIKNHFQNKKVLLFFPPNRSSLSLRGTCHLYGGVLNKTTLSKSQFPLQVTNKSGYPLSRPTHWN
jgi:hypothetical protein